MLEVVMQHKLLKICMEKTGKDGTSAWITHTLAKHPPAKSLNLLQDLSVRIVAVVVKKALQGFSLGIDGKAQSVSAPLWTAPLVVDLQPPTPPDPPHMICADQAAHTMVPN